MTNHESIKRQADALSKSFIEQLEKAAGDDQYKLLSVVDVALQASKDHQDRLKEIRLKTVQQMREDGEPMTAIAEAANVNDSYLARLIIAAGGRRRVDRTRKRRRGARTENAAV